MGLTVRGRKQMQHTIKAYFAKQHYNLLKYYKFHPPATVRTVTTTTPSLSLDPVTEFLFFLQDIFSKAIFQSRPLSHTLGPFTTILSKTLRYSRILVPALFDSLIISLVHALFHRHARFHKSFQGNLL
jgi:hypothetical protein